MGTSERTKTVRILSCCALAAVLAAAPGFAPFAGGDWGGAAHAKSDKAGGNGNGNGGNGNGNGGNGKGKGQSASGKSAAANGKAAKVASADGTLHPSQKGKWNAMNASTNALDAHIANGNFNGTIGALSQVRLAAMAAAGGELTPEQQAALDGFVDTGDVMADPQAIADALNEGTDATLDPQFAVDENGMVSCSANCDSIDDTALADKQAEADAIADELEADAVQEAYDQFLDDSRQRIIDESNKPLDEAQQEQLFDEMGDKWGLDLTPEEEPTEEETAEGEAPAEEDIVLVSE